MLGRWVLDRNDFELLGHYSAPLRHFRQRLLRRVRKHQSVAQERHPVLSGAKDVRISQENAFDEWFWSSVEPRLTLLLRDRLSPRRGSSSHGFREIKASRMQTGPTVAQ